VDIYWLISIPLNTISDLTLTWTLQIME